MKEAIIVLRNIAINTGNLEAEMFFNVLLALNYNEKDLVARDGVDMRRAKEIISSLKEYHPEIKACMKGENVTNKEIDKIDYQGTIDLYNRINEAFGNRIPSVSVLSASRKKEIKRIYGLLKQPTLDNFRKYAEAFQKSLKPFHCGENNRKWKADFSFFSREQTFIKVKEGSL